MKKSRKLKHDFAMLINDEIQDGLDFLQQAQSARANKNTKNQKDYNISQNSEDPQS